MSPGPVCLLGVGSQQAVDRAVVLPWETVSLRQGGVDAAQLVLQNGLRSWGDWRERKESSRRRKGWGRRGGHRAALGDVEKGADRQPGPASCRGFGPVTAWACHCPRTRT